MAKLVGFVATAGLVSLAAAVLAATAAPILILSAAGYILACHRWHS